MGAGGLDGEQGAGYFVFALCAAFKALVAVVDATFDGLVVASFEIIAIFAFYSAPAAAIGYSRRYLRL